MIKLIFNIIKNSLIFRIYLIIVICFSLAFIGFSLLAQVEESAFVLKDYLNLDLTARQNCPDFVDVNNLTMRDQCTGLVWARYELPTFYDNWANLQAVGADPGYSWDSAKLVCEQLAVVNGKSMFRLPTVEELLTLIKYRCDGIGCAASLDLDINKDGIADMKLPFFSNSTYWAINDFAEPADWGRDYKRSVNLKNGEVDNPIYNNQMRLNAWCIVERTPEIRQMQFSAESNATIANGLTVTGGDVSITYNTRCGQSSNPDDDCTGIDPSATCDLTLNNCTLNITGINIEIPGPSSDLIICQPGTHVEGTACAADTDAALGDWVGNPFNGYWLHLCGNGILDPEEVCDLTALEGMATLPVESSPNYQYSCDNNCQPTGGWLGDGIVNGNEICDPGAAGLVCTVEFSDAALPAYCGATIDAQGTEICSTDGLSTTCSALGPSVVGSSSTACNTTSPVLNDYACCKLLTCTIDDCGCCGRAGGAPVTPGYTLKGQLLTDCSGWYNTYFPADYGCKLLQSNTNSRNWQVTTIHTTATYQCWR